MIACFVCGRPPVLDAGRDPGAFFALQDAPCERRRCECRRTWVIQNKAGSWVDGARVAIRPSVEDEASGTVLVRTDARGDVLELRRKYHQDNRARGGICGWERTVGTSVRAAMRFVRELRAESDARSVLRS